MTATKKQEQNIYRLHGLIIVLFTIVMLFGMVYLIFAIIGFFVMCMYSIAMYLFSLMVINRLVNRFDLTLPNKKATCIHIANLCIFLAICFVSTVTGILMV